ncbi:tachykinins [Armigeres subalbatus]|uniref:tachykinins n=1 Tax=Armigeres subalbatus TaxID=124917 RepID=UPI002ED36FA9
MSVMTTIGIGTLALFILNICVIYAEPNAGSKITKVIRDKRDNYFSDNVEHFYPSFNQLDNAITTVLPLLDSDGTSKVVTDAPVDDDDDEDDALVSHSINDRMHYFRVASNNRIRPIILPSTEEKLILDLYKGDSTNNGLDAPEKKWDPLYPIKLNQKRAPSGFLGLRGKKYYYNGEKRVPSGFTGMRGKKSYYDMSNDANENYGQLESPNDANYNELLQKENRLVDELNQIYQMIPEIRKNLLISGVNILERAENRDFIERCGKEISEPGRKYAEEKRAPSGFLGLRGKRESEERKRSPFSSYFGTRGIKEPMVYGSNEFYSQLDRINWPSNELQLEINRTPPKRVPSGFLGLRGKKSTGEDMNYGE